MCEHQPTFVERQIPPFDGIRTLTIARPESTFVETLTLGNGVASSTDVPIAVASASRSSTPNSNYVGAILSGVVVTVVLLFVIWICCRKGNLHGGAFPTQPSTTDEPFCRPRALASFERLKPP